MVVEMMVVVGGANLTVRTRRWVGPYKSRGCGAAQESPFFGGPSDPDWGRGKDIQGEGGEEGIGLIIFFWCFFGFPVYFIFHLQTRWPQASARELGGDTAEEEEKEGGCRSVAIGRERRVW